MNFILQCQEPTQSILMHLHSMLTQEFGLEDKIRFKIPFYFQKSWICYLNPIKKGGVEICFLRANEFQYSLAHLDFKDRVQVAGISYTSLNEVDMDILRIPLIEAIELDYHSKYSIKKKKG